MSDNAAPKPPEMKIDRVVGRKRIGELLVERGQLSGAELEAAVKRAEQSGILLGQYLLSEGMVSDVELARALAEQMEMKFQELGKTVLDAEILAILPEDLVREARVLPIGREDGTLIVAVEDPKAVNLNEAIRRQLPSPYELRLAARSQIEKCIERFYGSQKKTIERLAQLLVENPDADTGQGMLHMGGMHLQVTIDSLLEVIFEAALRSESSDIHIDPADGFVRVRERIDGVLQETSTLDARVHQSLLSKLKVLAGLDITEKRKPQDGRFRYKIQNRWVDVRLSTLPTIRGERAVLRLLDKSKFKVKLDDIGITRKMADDIRGLLAQPHGILLVTGPTGSGKTTTVYSMLSHINEAQSNIITVEDPVEYQFDIINQVQIAPKAGLNFADLLRNILRQDPDVIMVGEIRDKETADTAIRAALTGHLVISTIHTNDSISTVHRLMDMGVESFLISSSILAILSQRLVRVLCVHCKVETVLDESQLSKLPPGFSKPDWIGRKVFEPRGCEECRNSGYRGRSAIAELLVPDEEVRRDITERVSRGEILAHVSRHGFTSLRQNAMEKVWSGETSIEEVLRNTV